MKSNAKPKSAKASKQSVVLRGAGQSHAPEVTAITAITPKSQSCLPMDVALRAYQLWQQDNQAHGNDVEHWLLAEKQLLAEGN